MSVKLVSRIKKLQFRVILPKVPHHRRTKRFSQLKKEAVYHKKFPK